MPQPDEPLPVPWSLLDPDGGAECQRRMQQVVSAANALADRIESSPQASATSLKQALADATALADYVPYALWLWVSCPVLADGSLRDSAMESALQRLQSWTECAEQLLLSLAKLGAAISNMESSIQLTAPIPLMAARDGTRRSIYSMSRRASAIAPKHTPIVHRLRNNATGDIPACQCPSAFNAGTLTVIMELLLYLFDKHQSGRCPSTRIVYSLAIQRLLYIPHNAQQMQYELPLRLVETMIPAVKIFYHHQHRMLEQHFMDMATPITISPIIIPQMSHRFSVSSMGSSRAFSLHGDGNRLSSKQKSLLDVPPTLSGQSQQSPASPVLRPDTARKHKHSKWKYPRPALNRESLRMILSSLHSILHSYQTFAASANIDYMVPKSSDGIDWAQLGLVQQHQQQADKPLPQPQTPMPESRLTDIDVHLGISGTSAISLPRHDGSLKISLKFVEESTRRLPSAMYGNSATSPAVSEASTARSISKRAMAFLEQYAGYNSVLDIAMGAKSSLALYNRYSGTASAPPIANSTTASSAKMVDATDGDDVGTAP